MSRITHIRFLGLLVLMLTMFSMSSLASSDKDYYSKVTAKAVGKGKVYVKYNGTTNTPSYNDQSTDQSGKITQKDAPEHTYNLYAQANSGYEFVGWYNNQECTGSVLSGNTPYSVKVTATVDQNATTYYYALFKPVFNFKATANTINGSYGTATATVTSKILGNKDDTSKSTTATFTATPKANCTFEGWYTDAAHTNWVSSNATYTPTITNNLAGTEATLTLYAWFKANQTLTWTQDPYDPNVVAGITHTGLAAATAKSAVSGSATGLAVTYTSNTPSVATVNSSGDVTGVKASVDAITITARQAGNNEYNAVEATRQFTVINKFQPTFEATGFRSSSGDDYISYVDDTPTITVANTTSSFTYVSSDPTVVSISKSGNVITLKALKVGSSTVTLNDQGNTTHYSATKTYNITVTRIPNTLAFVLSSTDVLVDGTIAVTFSDQNNTGTPIDGTITEETLSSGVNQTVDNETPVITYSDGVITARNAGTAKITFSQAETAKYAGKTSSTYTITVSKYNNNIIATVTRTKDNVSSTDLKLKYGETATLSYTYENKTSTPTVSHRSGTYTTRSGNTVTAGNTQGNDVYEITQAETYKYEAGYASFTIRVNNTDEATGYVLYDDEEHGWSTISSYTTATLSGPADVLSYDAYRWWGGVNKFYVMTSTNNGSSWDEYDNPDLPTSYQHYPDNKLKENVNRIKFETRTGATSEKRVKNILVTRKTYVNESHDTTKDNLGTVLTGTTKTSATITVSYSSTNGGNISIRSNNDHFVPSISTISVESNKKATSPGGTQYICGVNGSQTFTVTYTPDPDHLGTESATITIGDLFYSQTITLTATAAKRANTLAIIEDQSVKVDDVIANVYSSKNSDATITPTIENITGENVITYNLSTNKIKAVGAGTARLTLTQPATDYYYGATKSVVLTVNKYDQTLTWDNGLDETARTLEVCVSPVLTTNTATAKETATDLPTGLPVTYSSSNPTALEVNATTGALTAKAGGDNIIITATQAGNYKYNAASITRSFTVIKREYVTVTTSLTDGTNLFPLEGDNITIGTDALITAEALSIGNDKIVSASFDSNTFTLTALKEGSTTVRLVRDQTNDFFELDVTYTIRVVKPALMLNPTATPVISHEKYSSVTLNRTLKAGYSTIALPLTTTVEDIVGDGYDADDDWVAQLQTVTSSAADGYTLYFQKVANGAITANQPYVLHLANQVVNPTWTDLENGISVSAASAGTHAATNGYSGHSSWVMHANYSASMNMAGYYGIVNAANNDANTPGGYLARGGTNSTLAAFTAYITAPQANNAPRLRVAYVDIDGTTTFIEGLPFESAEADQQTPIAIYGPDGKRRSRLQPGLNIVHQADGTTRKVMY